jgi:hypothetical protein
MTTKASWVLSLSVVLFGCDANVSSPCGEEPGGGGGCGAVWECLDGEWVDVSEDCGPPPDECPATLAEAQGPCSGNLVCLYTEQCEGEVEREVTCVDGSWLRDSPPCEEPDLCPGALPIVGSDCSDYASSSSACSYFVECGGTESEVFVGCGFEQESYVWVLESGNDCTECRGLTAADCGVSTACQWLLPGCDTGAALEEGCYSTIGCQQADTCGVGEMCVLYSYDPCADLGCPTCSAGFGVCEDAAVPPGP